MNANDRFRLAEELSQSQKGGKEKIPIHLTCRYCHEYLGELVKNKLFKDGKIVLVKHRCKKGGG